MSQNLIDLVVNKLLDKKVKNVAIVMHNKPDGDSIGSSIALEEALKNIGKKVDLIIHNKIPQRFAPIVGEHRVNKKILPPFGKTYDLLIMVDFSDPNRTIDGIERLANFKIVLDHHISGKPYGDLYVCENCSATGMIVFKIIEKICEITPTIANAIYMAVITDTNSFKNNNTNSETHDFAAKLLGYGVDVQFVHSIFEDRMLSFFKLMGYTFRDIKYDPNYCITYLVVTRDKIKASGATGEEVASLIDQIKWVKGGDITFLFIEGVKNVRISARSKYTPVNKILEKFGGGGHTNAAGCAIEGAHIHNVVYDVLKYTRQYVNERNQNKKKDSL